ncbi:MAG: tetratricopeptide repeat protein [bacterium]
MKSMWEKMQKALGHFERKEYDQARKLVNELLDEHPDMQQAWFIKGVILQETGRSEQAGECYSKAGNLSNLWFRLALQVKDKDPERAVTYFDRILRVDEKNNLALLNKGLLLEKLHRLDEARACFRKMTFGREIVSRIFIPLGFMILLLSGAVAMIQRGEKALSLLVIASAVFCLFWLKRDAGPVIKMIVKKNKYK